MTTKLCHFGARPSHAEWQGKIVSLSGREGYLSLSDIGYGTGTGFKGYNCWHDWFPFFEGISEKAYSDKELEQRKNETVTYEDKEMSRYDAEQKQRAMERQIRKERSKLAALDTAIKSTDDEALKTSLKNDFDNLSVKLKSHEAKYKDFSYKTGLPPQKQRLQMYGFNRSVSQKAVHANKSVNSSRKQFTSQQDSGIISLQFNTVADPMREVMGAGLKSNPKEVKLILEELNLAGVEIEYRENAMCYQPSIFPGGPGKFIIDPEASYSAWVHEYTHFKDDEKDGYLGFRVFENTEKCKNRERHAYAEEIKLAEQLGRSDIIERLKELERKELALYDLNTE